MARLTRLARLNDSIKQIRHEELNVSIPFCFSHMYNAIYNEIHKNVYMKFVFFFGSLFHEFSSEFISENNNLTMIIFKFLFFIPFHDCHK